MALDLELLKKHVRSDDFTADDDLLRHYLEAAVETVVRYTNRTLEELGGEDDLPLMLQQASLMLAAHWYNQRETVSQAQMQGVPYSIEALVKPFRKLSDS